MNNQSFKQFIWLKKKDTTLRSFRLTRNLLLQLYIDVTHKINQETPN